MESSRAVSRCLQQLHRLPRSNLHGPTALASKRISSQCLQAQNSQSTSRPYSTTSRRNEEKQPKPPQSATQDTLQPQRPAPSSTTEADKTRIEPTTTTSTSTSTRPSARPSPSSPSSGPQKLSRSELGLSALASIDKLIIQNRERIKAANNPKPQPSKSQSAARTMYNEDVYGRGGSVAQRSSEISSSTPTFTTSNMHSLMYDLDGSDRGRSSLSSAPEIFLRLKPTLGKTAALDEARGVGLTRTFQILESKINKGGNSVKRDLMAQKFHVRRGQARKIHRRMRWRELFKEGFLGECARVRRMIKQGW